MFKLGLVAMVVASCAVANVAQAQSGKGPNGGTVVTSQGHPIEFVLKDQELIFYLGDDDGSPLSTKNIKGRATVQDAGKTVTVTLQSVEPNLMIGKLSNPLGSKARIVFSASFSVKSHSHTLTARYVTD